MSDWKEQLAAGLPGFLGALAALGWIRGHWLQLCAALIGGSAIAYWGGEWASSYTGAPIGFARLVLGLFGMAVSAALLVAIGSIQFGPIVARVLDKVLTKIGL